MALANDMDSLGMVTGMGQEEGPNDKARSTKIYGAHGCRIGSEKIRNVNRRSWQDGSSLVGTHGCAGSLYAVSELAQETVPVIAKPIHPGYAGHGLPKTELASRVSKQGFPSSLVSHGRIV